MDTIESDLIRELREALGADAVRSSSEDIVRMMKDESWLSPVLQRELERRNKTEGAARGVQAVVRPASEEAVRRLAAIAVRHRIALTPRGAGTSNFGLLAPEEGGLIVDFRGLSGEPQVTDGAVRAPAGTFQGTMEKAARATGQELPVLTTTYAEATIGGWLCGGHAGLGSAVHGAVWDGIVKAVRVVTLEEEPRSLTLEGKAALPLLHTFGAVGLIVDVTMRAGERHDWVEAVGFFPTFAAASAFVRELSLDTHYRHRAATAQEEGLMPGLRALQSIRQPGAGALLILDRAQLAEFHKLAAAHGGSIVEWQDWNPDARGKPSVAQMVFGHRMLWVKRLFPDTAFCHLYYDPDDPDATVKLLKERFGDELLCEMKFFRSPWMMRALGFKPDGLLPAALCVVPNGAVEGKVDEVLAFCDQAGIKYQNSHTNVIEDNGLFPDVAPIVRLKSELDPHNLLSRGRLRSAVVRP
ncbi:MAG TPA: FAD-binding oxidoreductase [Stellaceae bacterium]|nr:FAD-binding oxidoreductase [Stellaceae bacterium]